VAVDKWGFKGHVWNVDRLSPGGELTQLDWSTSGPYHAYSTWDNPEWYRFYLILFGR
jgi:hypothetical protein